MAEMPRWPAMGFHREKEGEAGEMAAQGRKKARVPGEPQWGFMEGKKAEEWLGGDGHDTSHERSRSSREPDEKDDNSAAYRFVGEAGPSWAVGGGLEPEEERKELGRRGEREKRPGERESPGRKGKGLGVLF
jgi:hypothetical protein